MIVQCADCKARYELNAEKVPPRPIRVRCPRCRAVFALDGRRAAAELAQPAPIPTPAPRAASAPVRPIAPSRPVATPARAESAGLQIEHHRPHAQTAAPSAPTADAPLDFEIERSASPAISRAIAPSQEQEPQHASALMMDAPAAPKPKQPAANPARDKSRRLARALVSDILIYHREARDRALAEGTLVQTLGQEIKKSWELYKERVTPEVANSTNHFREALNEILADGQKIF